MGIKYRAIHERVRWKKVGSHSSLSHAIDGEKGAKKILRGEGAYVKKLWNERGKPLCIFVWKDGDQTGYAFRNNPSASGEIQVTELDVGQLETIDKENGCSERDIVQLFGNSLLNQEMLTCLYPDELTGDYEYPEGASHKIIVNAYERNLEARKRCIEHYGPICKVCRMNFESSYGKIGKGFIHIHHTVPISTQNKAYSVDPITDLVPVCPNCHAMIHQRNPPFTIDEMKTIHKK